MMTSDPWIIQSLGPERLKRASFEATRRRIHQALAIGRTDAVSEDELRFVANGLELRVYELFDAEDSTELVSAASDAFQVARTVRPPADALGCGEWLVRLSCMGMLGDRGADIRRVLRSAAYPPLPFSDDDWGVRVWATILDIWLRLVRKDGWADLDTVQERVRALRSDQNKYEPAFLSREEKVSDSGPAWELMCSYHLAKAAEILAVYSCQGSVDGHFDVREQLEAQFDRALGAAQRGGLMDRESTVRLLARTARTLVENSIWTVTRAVNSRVTKFVNALTSRERSQPIFEMLPPQRRTLREEGLLGSGYRSVVVSLPTSSGKTLIAQFRMLQALNQFDDQRGWIAYLVPTRALVNQITQRLRRDFHELGVMVEKVSPALEVDGLEAGILSEDQRERQFRVLVMTPEKLDLMLRGGWEERIGRPLTLVVVDEAHNLGTANRGLKLELLLATINRECRYAQFLLLTPFIRNSGELARWLSPDSHKSIELGVDWVPNDRVVTIATPVQGESRGMFTVRLTPRHTSRPSLDIPDSLVLADERPLGLSWSAVKNSSSKLAAATAQILQRRGTVIVLADSPKGCWDIARTLAVDESGTSGSVPDLEHIKAFLSDEMGQGYPLVELLGRGIGVHHSGISEDVRSLVEWLTEKGSLRILVATTTIAQGVNFPVSGVVLANHQYRLSRFPFRQDMPPEDFWNIAGRAGRVDQGDIGVIAFAANNDGKVKSAEEFIAKSVGALTSTLVEMVQLAMEAGKLLQLESLSSQPGWSSFLQYLAHSYRQIGNHERFAAEIEQVLRGTLGFQALRRSHKGWADGLVQGVYNYAERLKGKPLKLVDATGFSWESVANTLVRVNNARIGADAWSGDLFREGRPQLQKMMGILLQVPELREPLADVIGGAGTNSDMLARIVCDWVQGRPLTEMARDYFSKAAGDADDNSGDATMDAMNRCCRSIFGRLTQTASWGLAALQSLTIGDKFETLPEPDQRILRNLPARVYYGVNSDEAVALRLLGVPRTAAQPMAGQLGVRAEESMSDIRARLRSTQRSEWEAALGPRGGSYHRIWTILEG